MQKSADEQNNCNFQYKEKIFTEGGEWMEYTGEFDFFYGKESERYHLLQLRPFKAKKYILEKHPNYKYTAEADKKNLRNPPYLLSYNDEEMESVRVKAPGEEGYILPAVVDSARKRALEV